MWSIRYCPGEPQIMSSFHKQIVFCRLVLFWFFCFFVLFLFFGFFFWGGGGGGCTCISIMFTLIKPFRFGASMFVSKGPCPLYLAVLYEK